MDSNTEKTNQDNILYDTLFNLLRSLETNTLVRRRTHNNAIMLRMLMAPSNAFRENILEFVTDISTCCAQYDLEECTLVSGRILALSICTAEDQAVLLQLTIKPSTTGELDLILTNSTERTGIIVFLTRVTTYLRTRPSIRPAGSAFAHLLDVIEVAIKDLSDLTWPDSNMIHLTGARPANGMAWTTFVISVVLFIWSGTKMWNPTIDSVLPIKGLNITPEMVAIGYKSALTTDVIDPNSVKESASDRLLLQIAHILNVIKSDTKETIDFLDKENRYADERQFEALILAVNIVDDPRLYNTPVPRGKEVTGDTEGITTSIREFNHITKSYSPGTPTVLKQKKRKELIPQISTPIQEKLIVANERDTVFSKWRALVNSTITTPIRRMSASNANGKGNPFEIAWYNFYTKDTDSTEHPELVAMYANIVRNIAYDSGVFERPTLRVVEQHVCDAILHTFNFVTYAEDLENKHLTYSLIFNLLFVVKSTLPFMDKVLQYWKKYTNPYGPYIHANESEQSRDVRLFLMKSHLVMPMLQPLDPKRVMFPWYAFTVSIDRTYTRSRTIEEVVKSSTHMEPMETHINQLENMRKWDTQLQRLGATYRILANTLFSAADPDILSLLNPPDKNDFLSLLCGLCHVDASSEEIVTRVLTIPGLMSHAPKPTDDAGTFHRIMRISEHYLRYTLKHKDWYVLVQATYWTRRRHALAWLCLVCINLTTLSLSPSDQTKANTLIRNVVSPLLHDFNNQDITNNIQIQLKAQKYMNDFMKDDAHPMRVYTMDGDTIKKNPTAVTRQNMHTCVVVQLIWALEAVVRGNPPNNISSQAIHQWTGDYVSDN